MVQARIVAPPSLPLESEMCVCDKRRAARGMRGAARASKSEPCCRTQEFCQCIHRDYAWLQSNGAVEGTVNKLKLIKRMGYCQAGFALLRKPHFPCLQVRSKGLWCCAITRGGTSRATCLGQQGVDFLHLEKVQHHRGRSAEKRNQHGHFLLLHIAFADGSNIFGEGTLNNAHALAFGKMEPRLFWLLVSRRIRCHTVLLLSDLDATSSQG
jgi:hypothetical protein